MRAAFYECDITPPLGGFMWGYYKERIAEDVYDKLYAKALVLEHDGKYAAIVDVDVCTLTLEMHDIVTKRVNEYTGLSPECICISANHTHRGAIIHNDLPLHLFADEPYKNVFYRLVADAVILAFKRLDEDSVTIKYGRTNADGIAFSRNAVLSDGTYASFPQFKPNVDHPLSEPDHSLSFLLFEKDGVPIGSLTNFALHQDTTEVMGYTGDYASALSDNLKDKFGRNFVSLFLLGACGDINSTNSDPNFKSDLDEYTKEYCQHRIIGKKLFEHIENMLDNLEDIMSGVDNIKQAIKIERRKYELDSLTEETQKHLQKYNDPKLTLGFLSYCLSNKETESNVYVQVIKLGDVIICALPGENYVKTGLKIKELSPYKKTIIATNCNTYTGYVPTLEAFDPQSALYEISTNFHSNLIPEAAEILTEKAVEMIKKIQ